MHVAPRSYLTAGIAILGAGAVALAPVQPLPQSSAISPALRSALAVQLATSIDPITPWVNTFQTATENISRLITAVTDNPLPILQQVIANQISYLQELPNIGLILQQVVGNIGNAIGAPFAVPTSCSDPIAGPCESISTANVAVGVPVLGTLTQQVVFALLPGILSPEQYTSLKPVLDFTTSPLSGVLLGSIGPVIAPVLALVNSVGAVFGALVQADFETAIAELINIPANVTNAFLNGGQFLDLTPVLGLAGVTLPPSIASLGFNMGGLLSTGISPVVGQGDPPAVAGPVAQVGFDGLAFTADLGLGAPVVDPGLSVGPLGALIGLNNQVANAIAPLQQVPAPVAAIDTPATATVQVVTATPETPTAVAVAATEIDTVSTSAQQSAERDTPAKTTPRTSRAARAAEAGADTAAGASTAKRSARAASRAG